MTVYYCDELADEGEDGEYVLMSKGPAQILTVDISKAVKIYEFQTRSLNDFEVDIDFILPIVFEMLSVKGEFNIRFNRYISNLITVAQEPDPPSYYEDLRLLATENLIHWHPEIKDTTSDLIAIKLFAQAVEFLGQYIYNEIKDVVYTNNKYLAFSLYGYQDGFITLVVNYVPVLGRTPISKSTTKVMELSINSVLGRYGKKIEFE